MSNRDGTMATIKNTYIKFCLMFHSDKNSYPWASKMTNITNQAKIYFNDYFYSIYIQIIKRQEYDYGSDMGDTKRWYQKEM